jgi:hypothetical protein
MKRELSGFGTGVRRVGWLPLALLPLSGCSGEGLTEEPFDGTSEVRAELFTQTGATTWPGHEVPVCFTSGTWNDSTLATWRNNVRLWVMDNISRYANIWFSGFGLCPSSTPVKTIKITRDDSFGNSTAFLVGYSSTENKIRFGRDSATQGPVIHEFMHKLGFDHEMNRTDTDSCATREGPSAGTYWTPYDHDSITNTTYCHSNAVLSSWDVVGLQAVFGRLHRGAIVGQGGQCLNVSGGGTNTGAPLVGWPCLGVANDKWSFLQNGLVMATISGQSRCANIQGGVVNPNGGTNLISWTCSASNANEIFHLTGVQWRAMGKMCITATSSSAGAFLEQQPCGTSTARESWDFFEGSTRIRLTNTNLCVDIPNGATALGTQPKLATCGGAFQLFSFANGEITFTTNRCFNVSGGDVVPGRRIGLWDGCGSGLANEYFYTSGLMHGMGQCMDEFGGNATLGNQIGVYPCVPSAANHRWEYHW